MKIWNNFLLALNKYTDFNGRSRRAEFWGFTLVSILFGMAASRWDSVVFGDNDAIETLVNIALFIPSIAVSARRLHDTGRSGWWQLIAFTGIGVIVLIFWYAQDGEHYDNKWGRNPKLEADDFDYDSSGSQNFDDQIL